LGSEGACCNENPQAEEPVWQLAVDSAAILTRRGLRDADVL
jgi:hypothetical protein